MARWKKRLTANHALRADDCRRHPRMWIEIGLYGSSYSAHTTARHIRNASYRTWYTPAGSFETRITPTDDGVLLYARYVGEGK